MSKKKKHKKAWIPYVGLGIGLIFFLLPFIFGIYTSQQQKQAQQDYTQQVNSQDNVQLLKKVDAYNKTIFEQQQRTGSAKGQKTIKNIFPDLKRPIAYISIPSIHLDPMVIYYGTSDWVLERGVGYLPWSSLPGGGKNTLSVISGHSGLANQVYFDNIKKLKNGDIVYVNVLGRRMAYSVYDQIVIKPDDLNGIKKMNIKPGKDEIAMVTCTPVFINSHRLIVFAKRVPLKKAQAKKVEIRDFWSLDHIFMMVIGLFLLLLIIYLIRQKIKARKANGK